MTILRTAVWGRGRPVHSLHPLRSQRCWPGLATRMLTALLAALSAGMWPAAAESYGLYRANLHVHTRYSRPAAWVFFASPMQGLPDNFPALLPGTTFWASRRLLHLDCVGLSDHAESIGRTLLHFSMWTAEDKNAREVTARGFVGLRGFEWTGDRFIHANAFGTDGYCGRAVSASGYQGDTAADLDAFWEWASRQPPGIVLELNHPWLWPKDGPNPLDAKVRDEVQLLEVSGGLHAGEAYGLPIFSFLTFLYQPIRVRGEGYYQLALRRGWHVAPTVGHDNFGPPTGATRQYHTGIWATGSSQEAVLDALGHRRTFAAEDREMRLWLAAQSQGRWYLMGDTLKTGGGDITVYAKSSDMADKYTTYLSDIEGKRVLVFPARGKVCGQSAVLSADRIEQLPQSARGERPVYLVLQRPGKNAPIAISAPLWLDTSPGDASGMETTRETVAAAAMPPFCQPRPQPNGP